MFCQYCGAQIPDGSAFCSACGAKQQVVQQPQQTYQQPASQDFAPAGAGYPAQPVQQQAPADGFMPIDTDIEGDEDLPF